MLLSLIFLCSTLAFAQARVTVYTQIALGFTNPNAPVATSPAAFNHTRLVPPAIPRPPPANSFSLILQQNAAVVSNLSIAHVGGCFWGFSIEMSVISHVLGKNSTLLAVPFLNLMSNLQDRCGSVVIRLGGNTQEFAVMVHSLPKGLTFSKHAFISNQTTQTPAVVFTIDMFYMAANISSLLNVKWFLGIPFNDSVNWRLTIAEKGQQILGHNLLGLQAGNEPDYYATTKHRPTSYGPQDYSNDVGNLIKAIEANSGIPNKNMLISPSVATGPWTPEQVWDTGFLNTYSSYLTAMAVEHYPNDNCAARFGVNVTIVNPQDIFSFYTNHSSIVKLVQPYLNSTLIAQGIKKPFYMFETNTASCGGFPGVSNTYGAALWAIDYGMQLAYGNFTYGLLHTGGENVFYNSFTSPPPAQSSFREWTVGAVYYSAIVLAEAFGTTNTSQIVDLRANGNNDLTPAYAIYEQGSLSKVALINFMDDNQTGTNELQVSLALGGAPQSVHVKYLSATSVSDSDNIKWAGQTLGNDFTVDGRFRGSLDVTTIKCDTDINVCTIPVPAPGFALVFLSNSSSPSQKPYISMSQATKTFSTSVYVINTANVAPGILATSNGHSGVDREQLGSTSSNLYWKVGALLNGGVRGVRPGVGVLVGLVVGGVVAGWALG